MTRNLQSIGRNLRSQSIYQTGHCYPRLENTKKILFWPHDDALKWCFSQLRKPFTAAVKIFDNFYRQKVILQFLRDYYEPHCSRDFENETQVCGFVNRCRKSKHIFCKFQLAKISRHTTPRFASGSRCNKDLILPKMLSLLISSFPRQWGVEN